MLFTDASEKSPKLFPFPYDLMKEVKQIDDLEVDICGRLWFYDGSNFKLYIFDLNQNKLMRVVQFNVSYKLLISSITIDVNESDCDNTYAYMIEFSTQLTNQILIYKFSENKHWWIKEPIFVDQQKNVLFNHEMEYYDDSVLIDFYGNGSRVLFLTFQGSNYLFGVPTSILKNSEKAASPMEIKAFGERPLEYSQLMYYDKRNSVLFFGAASNEVLTCWNTKRFPNEFSNKTTETISLFKEHKALVRDILTDDKNNFLFFILHYLPNMIPYQLFTMNFKELVNGTICDSV